MGTMVGGYLAALLPLPGSTNWLASHRGRVSLPRGEELVLEDPAGQASKLSPPGWTDTLLRYPPG